jgi:hypothetical protein
MKSGVMLLGLALWTAATFAQNPGTFTPTASMIAPRADHSATLLPGGKVLIAGGNQAVLPTVAVSSAELFDPSTGAFTATGNMIAARDRHSATLLPDGRVFIAGGSEPISAEIYDPLSGKFTATGDMVASPYQWQSATLLQDGRVFIASQPTAQLFDPITGTFTATSPYAAPPPDYIEPNGVTLLVDGRVLLTGGNTFSAFGEWTELYDPATGQFTVTGTPGGVTGWWYNSNTATLLMSGKVLVAGSDEYDLPADAELYDPAIGAVTALGKTTASHEYAAAALLPDGSVLITGGQLPGGNGQMDSDLYVPATSTFSGAGNMSTGRHEHTATLLSDGTVLIAGGFNIWPVPTSTAEIYRPQVLQPAPVLFSLAGDGHGQGAIWNAKTGELASTNNPATAGDVLAMYTTSLKEGGMIAPQVSIGGRFAEVLYFGDAPGYPGYFQVNFRVPPGLAAGAQTPVDLRYAGRISNTVTVSAR